jgi:hypothetical protein
MPLSTRKDVKHPYDYIPHACRCRRASETSSSIDMQRQCKSAIVCGAGRYPFIHTSTPPLSPGHTVAPCARRMCVLRARICEHSCANVRACKYACVRLTAMCVAKRSYAHSTPLSLYAPNVRCPRLRHDLRVCAHLRLCDCFRARVPTHEHELVCVHASDRHAATDVCMQTQRPPPPAPPGGEQWRPGAGAPLLAFVRARRSATDGVGPADGRFSARRRGRGRGRGKSGSAATGSPATSLWAPSIEDAAAACSAEYRGR